MSNQTLNGRFLLLQSLLILIDCISIAYISPILVSFGYAPLGIGVMMTLGALAASLARPLWGLLNDRFACAKQVTLLGTAAGIACYLLLTCGGGNTLLTVGAVMGLNVTVVCMLNFVDSWALRLISGGADLNYGATRAGGSLAYAAGAIVFGSVVSRWGFRPGNAILWVLFAGLTVAVLALPNPPPAAETAAGRVTLAQCANMLRQNRPYQIMLSAFFICTLATCLIGSFYSVLLLELGGTERDVGFALCLQAVSELPIMIGYTRLRARLRLPPAVLMGIGMIFYGVKLLLMGFSSTLGLALFTALLQGVSFALFTPASMDFMLETVPVNYLATSHLIFLSVGQGLASVIGNTLGGLLADQFGVSVMFRMAAILPVIACLLAWRTITTLKGRTTA